MTQCPGLCRGRKSKVLEFLSESKAGVSAIWSAWREEPGPLAALMVCWDLGLLGPQVWGLHISCSCSEDFQGARVCVVGVAARVGLSVSGTAASAMQPAFLRSALARVP